MDIKNFLKKKFKNYAQAGANFQFLAVFLKKKGKKMKFHEFLRSSKKVGTGLVVNFKHFLEL